MDSVENRRKRMLLWMDKLDSISTLRLDSELRRRWFQRNMWKRSRLMATKLWYFHLFTRYSEYFHSTWSFQDECLWLILSHCVYFFILNKCYQFLASHNACLISKLRRSQLVQHFCLFDLMGIIPSRHSKSYWSNLNNAKKNKLTH